MFLSFFPGGLSHARHLLPPTVEMVVAPDLALARMQNPPRGDMVVGGPQSDMMCIGRSRCPDLDQGRTLDLDLGLGLGLVLPQERQTSVPRAPGNAAVAVLVTVVTVIAVVVIGVEVQIEVIVGIDVEALN